MADDWKAVLGYEGLYVVNSCGVVKSLGRSLTRKDGRSYSREERVLTQHPDAKGYMKVHLCKDGKPKNAFVHRLVAQAFILNPDNLPQVNHINEDKADNRVENLEWTSCIEKLLDETGKRHGRLTVICRAGSSKSRQALWLCRCDCGGESIVRGTDLRTGHTKSCGCMEQETRVRNGYQRMRHGMSKSRLYDVWDGMRTRCTNPNHPHYKDYGGRGISVCEEWANDFQAFAAWALSHGYDENAPKGKCTLDRIDPDGNYCPENCRFADMEVQQNNRRDRKGNVRVYLGKDGIYHASRMCGAEMVK